MNMPDKDEVATSEAPTKEIPAGKRVDQEAGSPVESALAELRVLDLSHIWRGLFVARICTKETLQPELEKVLQTIAGHAPLSMGVTKLALGRVVRGDKSGGDDLIRLCYGSADFGRGIGAFVARQKPQWRGD